MTQTPSPLQVALEAVQAAEKIINQYYLSDIQVDVKADQSPVTIADQKAEEIIRTIIRKYYPDHSILGEEEGKTDKHSEYVWIIDPIDGTKNYTRQIPLFATQLALMKNKEIILGVSNAPVLGELIYAQKGKGAFANGKQIFVSKIDVIGESFLSYGSLSYFQKKKLLDQFMSLENSTRGHRGFGDAWAYHLLAQGKIDIVIESSIKIWDIAALTLIVQEAGGQVTDMQGQPVDEKTTSLVATNGKLQEQVLRYFA